MSRITRPLVAVTAAAAAFAVAASPALAVQSKQGMAATVTPVSKSKAATASAKRPANAALNLRAMLAYDKQDKPFSTTRIRLSLDRSISFGGAKLPGCTRPQVLLGTCDAKAKVGGGTALALAAGLNEPLKLDAYNGKDGRSLLIKVEGRTPVPMNDVLVAKLAPRKGAYGSTLTIDMPKALQEPAPGVLATLLNVDLTVKGGTATKPLIAVSSCPKSGLKVAGAFTYTDGTSQGGALKAACRK